MAKCVKNELRNGLFEYGVEFETVLMGFVCFGSNLRNVHNAYLNTAIEFRHGAIWAIST